MYNDDRKKKVTGVNEWENNCHFIHLQWNWRIKYILALEILEKKAEKFLKTQTYLEKKVFDKAKTEGHPQ